MGVKAVVTPLATPLIDDVKPAAATIMEPSGLRGPKRGEEGEGGAIGGQRLLKPK